MIMFRDLTQLRTQVKTHKGNKQKSITSPSRHRFYQRSQYSGGMPRTSTDCKKCTHFISRQQYRHPTVPGKAIQLAARTNNCAVYHMQCNSRSARTIHKSTSWDMAWYGVAWMLWHHPCEAHMSHNATSNLSSKTCGFSCTC